LTANKAIAQQQRFSNLYVQAHQNIPISAVPGAIMHQAVEAHDILLKQHASPLPLLKEVGAAMVGFPNLSITKINWASSTDPGEETPQAGSQPAASITSTSDDSGDEVQEKIRGISPVLTISGAIDIGPGGVRKAIEQLDNLGLRLSTLAAITRAEVINYPLEINPEKTLSGGAGKEAAGRADGRFSIRITGLPVL